LLRRCSSSLSAHSSHHLCDVKYQSPSPQNKLLCSTAHHRPAILHYSTHPHCNACLRRHQKERTRSETLCAQPDFISSTPSARKGVQAIRSAIAARKNSRPWLNLVSPTTVGRISLQVLSSRLAFCGKTLSEAVRKTFLNRGAELPVNSRPLALTPEFYDNSNKKRQWTAFCLVLRKECILHGKDGIQHSHQNTEDLSCSCCGSFARDNFVPTTVEARGPGRGIGPADLTE